MNKVEADVVLRKKGRSFDLFLKGKDQKLAEVAHYFLKKEDEVELECTFSKPKIYKSNRQLAYLWGILAPKFLAYLKDAGYTDVATKEKAIRKYAATSFGLTQDTVDVRTGAVKQITIRLSEASKDQMLFFIQNLFLFLLENGMEVMTSEEYFNEKKWTQI